MTKIVNIKNNSSFWTSASASYENLTSYQKNISLFWCFSAVCLSIAIVTIIGNGMVLAVAKRKQNLSRLRYFDGIVKSLAVTDLLFGLIGVPLMITNYYLGRYSTKISRVFQKVLMVSTYICNNFYFSWRQKDICQHF